MVERQRTLVMGHVLPDGDCVSSAIGVARYMKGQREDFDVRVLVLEDTSPTLRWMFAEAEAETVTVEEAIAWEPENITVVDCKPTEERTGFPIEKYMAEHPDVRVVNIDHHAGRVGEAPLPFEDRVFRFLDIDASSTAEIVITQMFPHPILYVGLVTDTGDFKFSNPNWAMRAALMLNLSESTITKYRNKLELHLDFDQLDALMHAKFYYDGIRSLLVVETHSTDAEILHTWIDLTRGFDFVAIIQSDGYVSLRTSTDLDLVPFAKKFGGGGHAKAAGCKLTVDNRPGFEYAFEKYISEGRSSPSP